MQAVSRCTLPCLECRRKGIKLLLLNLITKRPKKTYQLIAGGNWGGGGKNIKTGDVLQRNKVHSYFTQEALAVHP